MVRVVAHRGFSARAPENTLAAFRLAIQQECDAVELDIQFSRDLEPVVMHDDRLDRTTNGSGLISDLTLAEMKGVDAGLWFGDRFQGEPVPSLRDVLELIGPTRLGIVVELKECEGLLQGGLPVLAKTLSNTAMSARIILKSFDLEAVRRFHQLAPDVQCGALFNVSLINPVAPDCVGQALACGAAWISVSRRLLTRSLVEDAHDKGLQVLVWTVDARAHIQRALRLGVDGIISNVPDRVQEEIRKRAGT